MTARRKRWAVRLTTAAQADIEQIVHWTADQFGARQARMYGRTLSLAIEALMAGADVAGTRSRDEIAPGLRSLHGARQGRRGRHLVIFRVGTDGDVVEVLRVLHDAMDLQRHVPPD